jgi:UDPglucose 6-dehydrogenase
MKISVIGCGYLGAVHAASMAELGHDVVGIDVDRVKVEALQHARAPF